MRKADTPAQPESCPHEDHGHILAMCFSLPSDLDAPLVALLLAVDRIPLCIHAEKTEIIVASHFRPSLHFLSALLHGVYAGVGIFCGKPPRSGSLSPFAR